jgi:cytoskeletal protein RodZ
VPEVPQGDGDTLSFGTYLRSNRTLRELSLDEVATATRLPARIVAALEADDFGTLQDRGYALLAARSCATAIGLDPEEAALRLEEELQRLRPGPAARAPIWRRWWDARPREPLFWMVVGFTVLACVALLLRRH